MLRSVTALNVRHLQYICSGSKIAHSACMLLQSPTAALCGPTQANPPASVYASADAAMGEGRGGSHQLPARQAHHSRGRCRAARRPAGREARHRCFLLQGRRRQVHHLCQPGVHAGADGRKGAADMELCCWFDAASAFGSYASVVAAGPVRPDGRKGGPKQRCWFGAA